MKFFIPLISFFILHFSYPPVTFSQQSAVDDLLGEGSFSSLSLWDQAIQKFKRESARLTREYKKLVSEYDLLKSELESFKNLFDQLAQDNASLEEENNLMLKNLEEKEILRKSSEKKKNTLEDQVAKVEDRNIKMRQELAKMDKAVQLWEHQLADLNLQKQQLMLEFKLKEAAQKKMQMNEKSQKERFQETLLRNEIRGEKTEGMIDAAQEQYEAGLKELEVIKEDNQKLVAETSEMRTQKERQLNKNKEFLDENKHLIMIKEEGFSLKMRQKEELAAVSMELESKVNTLREDMERIDSWQESKRELLKEALKVDEDNEKLRQQMSSLMDGITQLIQEDSALDLKLEEQQGSIGPETLSASTTPDQ